MNTLLFYFLIFCGSFVIGAVIAALMFGAPLMALIRRGKGRK